MRFPAVSKGAKVLKGKVDGIEMEGDEVKAVRVGDRAIETDCCVIAMGPWSCMAEGPTIPLPSPLSPLLLPSPSPPSPPCSPASCSVLLPYLCSDWFPGLSLPMQGVRSTSIVYKSEEVAQLPPYSPYSSLLLLPPPLLLLLVLL